MADELTFSAEVNAVILPEAACTGLNSVQLSIMKETVFNVNQNFRIAGEAIKSSAEELVRLKSVIPNRSWTRFIESGALPLSGRTVRDLVRAHEWMANSTFTDGDLVGLSARTLGKLSAASPEAREKLVKKSKSGAKVTDRMVDAAIGKVQTTITKKSEVEKLRDENARLKEENSMLRAKLSAAGVSLS